MTYGGGELNSFVIVHPVADWKLLCTDGWLVMQGQSNMMQKHSQNMNKLSYLLN